MAVAGLDKFSHLEDKIHRTVELCKTLKQEKEALEQALADRQRELTTLATEKEQLAQQITRLQDDRDAMKLKVEAMLDAIAVLEMEAEMSAKR